MWACCLRSLLSPDIKAEIEGRHQLVVGVGLTSPLPVFRLVHLVNDEVGGRLFLIRNSDGRLYTFKAVGRSDYLDIK